MPSESVKVGIDYRSALVNREGIGRAVRELVRAAIRLEAGPLLGLYGTSLRAPSVSAEELGLAQGRAELHRRRFPARLAGPWLKFTRRGLDDVLGADLVHHFQLSALPVRRALQIATLWDLIYLNGGNGYLDPGTAREMEAAARALASRADRLVVTSEHVAREVRRELDVGSTELHVVPLGGDHILHTAPEDLPAGTDPFLLTVSRIDPRKNHAFALRVFERLAVREPRLRWKIAGPLGYRGAELRAELEHSSQASRIDFLGAVPEGTLRSLYERCAVFVFPSLDEGFGLPPLEAMTCGAPTVVSNRGSLPEVAGQGAAVVDPGDAKAWEESIARALGDPGTWRKRALQRAGELTWSQAARQLTDVWRATQAQNRSSS